MKYIKFRLFAISLPFFLLTLFSCEKESKHASATGSIQFSLSTETVSGMLKSAADDTSNYGEYQALLTIHREDHSPYMENKSILLYRFGNSFTSGKLEMETGAYYLMKFMIIQPDGKVIMATPVEGSALDYLVNDPLPSGFKVEPGKLSTLQPEVIPVEGHSPQEFGYANFTVHIIKPTPFYVMAMNNDSLIMAPIQLASGTLEVRTPDGWSHSFTIEPKINELILREATNYLLNFYQQGQLLWQKNVNLETILKSGRDNPYVIYLYQEPVNTMIFQPGPEEGKDAMITNLDPMDNFGNYPYFEASFLSEPILTVMRRRNSLIHFDLNNLPKSASITKAVLALHFETPLWDSLYLPPDGSYPQFTGVLQQIVEPWKEDSVTWSNQPATITANQVFVEHHPEMSSSMRRIDVTSLFVPLQEIAAPNYGMYFKLADNDMLSGFRFASSDHPVPEMRPKLIIHYK